MQLSASTLPLDPTSLQSNSTGCSADASEKDSRTSGKSDFGALLSAHTERERPEVKTKNPASKAAAHSASKSPTATTATGQAESPSAVSTTASEASSNSETESAISASPAMLVDPAAVVSDNAIQPLDPAAITISWLSGVSNSDTALSEDPVGTQEETSVVDATSTANQPVVGSTLASNVHASLRAYGLDRARARHYGRRCLASCASEESATS